MTIQSHGRAFAAMQNERALVPDDVLCVYIQDQVYGKQVADYYMNARSIPTNNIVAVNLSWVNTDGLVLSDEDTQELLKTVTEFITANKHIRCICLCGEFPTRIPSTYTQGMLHAGLISAINKPFFTYKLGVVDILAGSLSAIPNIPISSKLTKPYQEMDNAYRATMERAPQTANYHFKMWEPNKYYEAGREYIMTETLFPFTSTAQYPVISQDKALMCIVSGTSSDTEPTISTAGTVVDGEVTWECKQPIAKFYVPAAYRHPKDYYNSIKENSNGRDGWEILLTYPVTLLDAPNVEPLDPNNSSRFSIVKRMIDDSIEVESKNLKRIESKVLIGNGSAAVPQGAVYAELVDRGHDLTEVYYTDLSSDESSIPGSTMPSVPKYAAGNSSLLPTRPLSNFNFVSDVFFAAIGALSYFSKVNIPWTRSEMEYAQGAITLWNQSCGALDGTILSIDYFITIRDIDNTIGNNGSPADAYDTKRFILYESAVPNKTVRGFRFIYTGSAATTATVQVTSLNTIELFEDGVSVKTINFITGTVSSHVETVLNTTLPPDWNATLDCSFVESRAMRALLNGACVAIGAPHEPTTAAAPLATNLIDAFLYGHCLGEAVVTNLTSGGKVGSMNNPIPLVYGDPLYRPFHAINNLL